MKVLGIETSCDETGVALVSTQDGLLAHCLHTQIAMHAPYGGVVPELASRDHVRKVIPLVKQCLEQAEVKRAELDAIAYTAGPGLMGALLVGASAAQGLAWSLGIPSVPVHHMEAHLLAPMLDETVELNFPFIALLVSGGHTLLLEAKALGDYEILGQSVDDAVGEAFDKTAKILDLGYPGGPKIEKLAKQGREERYTFPRPMLDRAGLNFSFSGLKTHALTTFRDSEQTDQDRADVALAFQTAAIDVLTQKCMRALEQTGNFTLVVAGGVSANTHLRENLQSAVREHGAKVIFPKAEFCTDNGAMIAYAGSLYLETQASSDYKIQVRPRWPMSESLQAS